MTLVYVPWLQLCCLGTGRAHYSYSPDTVLLQDSCLHLRLAVAVVLSVIDASLKRLVVCKTYYNKTSSVITSSNRTNTTPTLLIVFNGMAVWGRHECTKPGNNQRLAQRALVYFMMLSVSSTSTNYKSSLKTATNTEGMTKVIIPPAENILQNYTLHVAVLLSHQHGYQRNDMLSLLRPNLFSY